MPYTISAKPNGKSRLLLEIPEALSMDPATLAVTDATAGATSPYAFTLTESVFLGQPGHPCRLTVTVRTTTVGTAASGHLRVTFQYHDLSNRVVAFDSGLRAANFVAAEAVTNQTPTGPTQTLMSNVGGEQVFVIPVTGLCCVKSGVATGEAGETWDVALSGQTPDSLWAKVVFRPAGVRGAKKLEMTLPPMVSVTLTTEDDVARPCRPFRVAIFEVPDDNG